MRPSSRCSARTRTLGAAGLLVVRRAAQADGERAEQGAGKRAEQDEGEEGERFPVQGDSRRHRGIPFGAAAAYQSAGRMRLAHRLQGD